MMYSKNGERDDDHENSSKDTPCTDMATDRGAAPRVLAGCGNRDLCTNYRRRALARIRLAARNTEHELEGAVASAACRRRSHSRHPLYRRAY